MHVGRQLMNARKLRGLSQNALGQAIDCPVTFQQMQKYETGHNRIGASKIWEFSRVLKVRPSYFFDGLDEKVHHHHTLVNTKLININNVFSKLPDHLQNNLVEIIKGLANSTTDNKYH